MKNKEEVKPKAYYDVKVECLLPATLLYRVLAEDPEQAIELSKKMTPSGVQYKIVGKKELKIRVYDAGSTMIRFIKNLLGG